MGIRRLIIKALPCRGHRPNFFAHFDFFGGSDISKDDIFELPFSISLFLVLGVGSTSSIFVKPLLERLTFCTSFGKVDLLGVNAVATLLADLRIVFLTSHDRFLARYQRIDDATIIMLAIVPAALLVQGNVLPKITTQTTTTMIAMIPPLDMVIDPESGPAAPSSLSPVLEPADEPASPAEGPLPGWMGADVASEEK